jgi:signal transduction histidine kinase
VKSQTIGVALWGLLACMSLLLPYLYFKSQAVDYQVHARILQDISGLKGLNAALNEDILKTRLGIIQTVDDINRSSAILHENSQLTRERVPPALAAIMRPVWQKYDDVIRQKTEAVEAFKSRNAILNNSVSYLPVITKQFFAENSKREISKYLSGPIREVLENTMIMAVDQGFEHVEAVEKSVAQIEALREFHDGPLATPLGNIVGQAKIFLKIKPEVDELVDTVLELPVSARIEDVYNVYVSAFAAIQKETEAYRTAGFVVAGVLVLVIGLVLFRYRQLAVDLATARDQAELLNVELEQRVIERTRLLEEETRKAEAANLAKSEFLSAMSHELRTPLNSILGFSSILEKDLEQPLSEDQGESVSMISRGGRLLLTLVDSILDLSKIESGDVGFTLSEVDLDTAVQEATDMIGIQVNEAGITLDVVSSPGIAISADPVRVHQVLLNLLSNAIKYGGQGGHITLETGVSDDGMISVSVSDTGPGIAMENHEKIFESFDRLGFENSGIEGAGIGLTITRKLMEAMGGKIRVQSAPGEGACFTLYFQSSAV